MTFLIAILNIALLFFISWVVWRGDDSLIKRFYWPALVLKLLAGLASGIIYSRYFPPGDSFYFFQEASRVRELTQENISGYLKFLWTSESQLLPSGVADAPERALFMIKITSLFSLISLDNYWISSLYFSLLSFFGAWRLTSVVIKFFPDSTAPAVIAFLFFPSSVFWSSGIIKESIAMAALFYLSSVFVVTWKGRGIQKFDWLLIPLAIIVLWKLKYYYAALFLPVSISCLLALYTAKVLNKKFFKASFAIFIGLLLSGLIIVTFMHPNFRPQRLMNVIIESHDALVKVSSSDNVIHYTDLRPTIGSLIANIPLAMLSGLFRPFIWEAGNFFKMIASLENALLLMLAIFSIKRISALFRFSESIVPMSIIIYCLLLFAFLALSTPNFGTLVRYRVGALPFFAFIILHNPITQMIQERTIRFFKP